MNNLKTTDRKIARAIKTGNTRGFSQFTLIRKLWKWYDSNPTSVVLRKYLKQEIRNLVSDTDNIWQFAVLNRATSIHETIEFIGWAADRKWILPLAKGIQLPKLRRLSDNASANAKNKYEKYLATHARQLKSGKWVRLPLSYYVKRRLRNKTAKAKQWKVMYRDELGRLTWQIAVILADTAHTAGAFATMKYGNNVQVEIDRKRQRKQGKLRPPHTFSGKMYHPEYNKPKKPNLADLLD